MVWDWSVSIRWCGAGVLVSDGDGAGVLEIRWLGGWSVNKYLNLVEKLMSIV